MRISFTFIGLILTLFFLNSCGKLDPTQAPTKKTPIGAKVDLTGVSLTASQTSISQRQDGRHELRFDYTLENTSGSNIEFLCIYASIDDLIEVNLTDKKNEPISLGKRLLDGLTLPQPRPRNIPVGKITRNYSVPIATNTLKKSDPVSIRIRLHAPSRYDELRTSLEAPPLIVKWPGQLE